MYKAYVAKLQNVRRHPNADRIQLASVLGNQVVIGLEHQDGELGVYFPIDGQLSQEFCEKNDLIGYVDEQGNKKGGFFDHKRRVRAQKFRGEKSEGFWCPLSTFSYLDYSFKEGESFTEINGHAICNKYYTPQTLRQLQQRGSARRKSEYFLEHVDTEQYRFCKKDIQNGAVVWVTEKLHGTSGRVGYLLDDVKLPWWKQMINKFYPVFPAKAYTRLNGSRRVVLQENHVGYHGSDKFRLDLTENLQLHRGETIYFEIVGYVNGAPIMQQNIGDRDLQKTFGDRMIYSYGCNPDECKMFVYRITSTNEDGVVTELSWPQVTRRCAELGVDSVPRLANVIYDQTWSSTLDALIEELTEGISTLDAHIREGVVLRVEQPDGKTLFLKNKSFTFGLLEGYIKDQDSYVDMEESA